MKRNMKTLTKISLVALTGALVLLARPVQAITEAELEPQAPAILVKSADRLVDNESLEQVESVYLKTSKHDISFKKQINGDAICASSTRCVIDGVIEDDALIAAMTVEIRGEIKGDVRAAANELVIETGAKIAGNVSIFAPKLTIKKGVKIGKDAILMGDIVRVEGRVDRDVVMVGEENYIDGQIGRNAEIRSSKHTRVSNMAKITGSLHNVSVSKDIASAVIGGEFRHEEAKSTTKQRGGVLSSLIWSLSIGTLLIVVTIFRPRYFQEFSRERFKLINVFYIGIGYSALIGLPMGAVLMMMTIIGIPVAVLAMMLWMLMTLLAIPVAIYYLTNNALVAFDKTNEPLAIVLGVIIYALINTVLVLSIVVNLVLVGLGAGLFIKLLVGGFSKQQRTDKQAKEA